MLPTAEQITSRFTLIASGNSVNLATHSPKATAKDHVPFSPLDVFSRRMQQPAKEGTVNEFIREVAALGGFLKRKHDGQPGWKTIWSGWQYLIQLTPGYHIANPSP